IVGHFDSGKISGCTVKGKVNQTNDCENTGGIAGIVSQFSEISNCTVEASVNSIGQKIGGILGQAENGVVINACTVSGAVTTVEKGYVAGICALTKNAESTFKSCNVSGAISGGWYVGGILGFNDNADSYVQDCKCSSTITPIGNSNGGIVGLCAEGKKMQIERCEFSGTISGGDNLGGIIGWMRKNTNSTSFVKDCIFSGTIDNGGQKVGGIVGELSVYGQVYNCISTGTITGWQAVGGICGRADGEGWEHIYNQANKVEKCLVWGDSITATRKNENGGSSAVVVGHTSIKNQLTDCYRRASLVFNGSWGETPYDQENSWNEDGHYLVCNSISGTDYCYAYHGKASQGTASAEASELGWDTTVWDLSGDVPVLK
ncbi:MAG: GLUG motif-containing protein, partial [Candidatus Cryptobacteroides sp.]